ncbi:MAG: IclR family transcriptional regulator domain-containing protein [Gammaproteobacteria bacterium]
MTTKQPKSATKDLKSTADSENKTVRHNQSSRPSTPAEQIDDLTGDPNFMSSLGRGLAVISAFNEQTPRQTIAQISQTTAIPRASVRRCLLTLQKLGYVQSESHLFSLSPKILSLCHAYLSSTPLVSIAQPVLDRVSRAIDDSCSLGILDGDEILYLARSATSRIMSVVLNVGSRLPVYCTSMGRVLLASLPEDELDAYLARAELKPLTERTITDPGKLRQLVAKTRQTGMALVDQELEIGLRSIAVPVRDRSGAVIASLNVGILASRMTLREMEKHLLPHLQDAAAELRMMQSY